jgi:cytochrome c biogenesis protein CcmG, thiol:disulfide interchange protein DsbE
MKSLNRVLRCGELLSAAVAAGCVTALMAGAVNAAEAGQPAPAFTLPGPSADVSLAALKGKIVLVDFWASWCVPCRHSFPWMNQMQARYGARGFHVLAINVDAKRTDADTFLAQVPAQFGLGFDSAGDTPKRYAVKGMPTSVLIGADGRVLMQHAGFRDDDKAPLEAAIVAALKQAGH